MTKIVRLYFKALSGRRKGQGIIEYVFIISIVSLVLIFGLTQLRTQLEGFFTLVLPD